MAAFSHAVPLVCIPLGRDQPGNAARAAELGVALALPSDAGPDQIRAAVSEALGSASLRSSSEWMAPPPSPCTEPARARSRRWKRSPLGRSQGWVGAHDDG
jgi:UDP:flavonoid glycosyltransferase YjiC (YdhE family)